MSHFSIAPHRPHLLPVLRQALAINPDLRIVASPWSPPGWMKDSGSMVHGRLLPQFQPAFAAYLTRFVDAYAAEGVPIYCADDSKRTQLRPARLSRDEAERAGARAHHRKVSRPDARETIPRRRRFSIGTTTGTCPARPLDVLADPVASRFIAGVAWHCYDGEVSAQTPVHDAHPDKDAYMTECSGGNWEPSWERSLLWFTQSLIIGSTRGWSRGVQLWNLALDERHGPHAGGCADCRGVVTINSKTGAITRNVEYYVLAHASRFVRPGAHRIKSATGINGLESVAFQNSDDNSIALIVLNGANASRRFLGAPGRPGASTTHYRVARSPPSSGIRSLSRRSREEAPTYSVRAPVTVCHAESAMDQ